YSCCLSASADRLVLHFVPTRRSSDLVHVEKIRFVRARMPVAARICDYDRNIAERDCIDARRAHAAAGRQPGDDERVDPSSLQHRSEEHTSELQSRENLVCRLLLEKKK